MFGYGLCLALGVLGTGCMADGSVGNDEAINEARPAISVPAAAQAAVVPAAQTGVKVQDRSHDNDNPDNTLYALYQVVNTSASAVPLSSLTMRYWFTNESPSDPLEFDCDWAQVNCSNITAKFVVLSPARSKANTYLEISFRPGAGSVAAGRNSGEIQTRVHHVNWSSFNTTETYSFISDPSFVYKDTQTVTLYQDGALIWGVEPSA
ncbi:MAG TPA: cellulose binding domain-containing protein [Kofleriaceae bacterium]